MKDILVCPLFQRPAFLEVWIELMTKVKGAEELFYIFALDYGHLPLNEFIIKRKFPFDYGIIKTPRTKYKMAKQSYNVLNALGSAAKSTDGLVFYLEEDVFPGIDFINWHREIHKVEPDIFCSIATRNNNTKFKVDESPEKYYLSENPDYQALGSCFKSKVINELIIPHFSEDYLTNPQAYCRYNFPDSIIGSFYVEQDGLIRRILESSGMKVAFPYYPRAYHGGFYGYHRPHKAEKLNHEKQVKAIKEIAFSHDRMKSESRHPEYYEDSMPVDLNIQSSKLIKSNPGW